MIVRFCIQFIFFWLKVAFSGLFVMALQIMVGQKSLEQHLESVLKNSSLGRQIKQFQLNPSSPPTDWDFSSP